ncbi:Hpt domain-containing protein [Granulicella pectinivorans]|uniref:Hpt domain-containing protein n=1 Tax=Granulicella pectinivorans TaxID=474950 RepID=UPI0015878FAB|nr:Hpt domain-containing protein [Granulicella pectinivorans]
MSDAAAKTAALLATMWEKNLPVLRERVAVLDRAAQAALAGALHDELRVEAAAVAHKLAGSLGMFGYPEGTRVARELEVELGETNTTKAARLEELVHTLRAVLPL